jgi:predicted transcriptional regulator
MSELGPLQLRIMRILWKNSSGTVGEVLEVLNGEPGVHELAYTTVLTVLRNLVRREFVSQTPEGRSHRFRPLIDPAVYRIEALRQLRDRLFDGSLQEMLATLAHDETLPADDHAVINEITGRFVRAH